MSQRILVDTDILIDVARSVDIAINRLQAESQSATLAISTITQMELIVGCRNRAELTSTQKFLRYYQLIEIDRTICEEAVRLLQTYCLSHGLRIPDALIAATATVYNIPLLSKNQRDYRFIQGLNLLPYP